MAGQCRLLARELLPTLHDDVATDPAYSGFDAGNVLVTNLDNETPTGNPNDIYVWDIAFDSRLRGKGGAKHDERVLVTIRHDSDADGLAEATDEVVAGATVEIVITGPTGGTFTGVTDGSGVFTTASSRYCVLRLLTTRFFVRVQVGEPFVFPSSRFHLGLQL